jgi:uncharacterized protein (DUF4415 family)
MKREISNEFTSEQRTEVAALAEMPDEQIDTSDAPEVRDWTGARRGLFYRPGSGQRIVSVDADVVDWFQKHTPAKDSYQDLINQALREYVVEQARKAG